MIHESVYVTRIGIPRAWELIRPLVAGCCAPMREWHPDRDYAYSDECAAARLAAGEAEIGDESACEIMAQWCLSDVRSFRRILRSATPGELFDAVEECLYRHNSSDVMRREIESWRWRMLRELGTVTLTVRNGSVVEYYVDNADGTESWARVDGDKYEARGFHGGGFPDWTVERSGGVERRFAKGPYDKRTDIQTCVVTTERVAGRAQVPFEG